MPKRRWWIRIAIGVTVALGVACGAVAVAAPSVAAVACPRCYGLTGLGGGVYAERDDDSYRRLVDAAEQRVAAFYGGREAHARVLICATDACYRRIGGGAEKGRALRTKALLLSPAGANEVIAAHELAHLELRQRLGAAQSAVPPWFNEGLAVVVSADPRYLGPGPDRCRVPYGEALGVTRADWSAVTKDGGDQGYLRAACVVSHWVADRGGPSAVLNLISDLRAGKPVF